MPAQMQSFCYVENNSLTFAENSGVTLEITFPQDVVADLEVIDKEKCIAYLEQFLKSNAVKPSPLVILLSPAITFDQEIGQVSPHDIETITQKFIDTIPFENVTSKKMVIGGKTKVVGANKDLIDSIRKAFEKTGFQILSVAPFSFLQQAFPELATSVEPVVIFNKFDAIKQYSIAQHEIIRPIKPEEKKGLQGGRDMALLGVFGLLMLILIYMVLSTYVFAPKTSQVTNYLLPTKVPSQPLVFPTTSPTTAQKTQQNTVPQPQSKQSSNL